MEMTNCKIESEVEDCREENVRVALINRVDFLVVQALVPHDVARSMNSPVLQESPIRARSFKTSR